MHISCYASNSNLNIQIDSHSIEEQTGWIEWEKAGWPGLIL